MVHRGFWKGIINDALKKATVVWLSGIMRSGKTYLCRDLEGFEYLDCELPSNRRCLEDSGAFLELLGGGRVVLDEIHRLADPSELLKIAADHYPTTRIVATGSSTLGATSRFRDTLTGRKVDVWLTPMVSRGLQDFGARSLDDRLLSGGQPPFFLQPRPQVRSYQDWLDAYWSKDILELFRLERRSSFLRFAELIFSISGGLFEARRFSAPREVSRTTIAKYLAVLEATYVVHVVRPWSSRTSVEIVATPKVYGFDTGFVGTFRGIGELRAEGRGVLREHYVPNELYASLQHRDVRYWRDKRSHEVDFIPVPRCGAPLAIERKWNPDAFEPEGLLAFRRRYPAGQNFVISPSIETPFERHVDGVAVTFAGLADLVAAVTSPGR
jgi:predicted AAA+ superfamily ATPase